MDSSGRVGQLKRAAVPVGAAVVQRVVAQLYDWRDGGLRATAARAGNGAR